MCVSALKFLQGDVKENLKLQWRPQHIGDDRLRVTYRGKLQARSGTEIKGGYMDFRWQSRGSEECSALEANHLHHKLQTLDSELQDLVFH